MSHEAASGDRSLRSRLLLAIALLIGAVFLAWHVVRYSLVAAISEDSPMLALAIRSDAPAALIARADRLLNAPLRRYQAARAAAPKDAPPAPPPQPPSAETIAKLSAWTRQALRAEPLQPRGFRILGQIAEMAGNEGRTAALMDAAAHLSIRESAAMLWRLDHRLKTADIAGALGDANALLHTRPDLGRIVLPVLARISEIPQGTGKLVAMLARRPPPPWRSGFFGTLPRTVRNPQSPLGLYLALAKTPAPPSPRELAPYLDTLIGSKHTALAYYTWLQFLPPERLARAGFLYNGDFRFDPTGLPFDWRISPIEGAYAQLSHIPGARGNRALLVEFFGRRALFRHVSEIMTLGPGPYHLTGRTKADLAAAHGLVWRLTCLGRGGRIAETRPIKGRTEGWQTFETRFEVPPAGCPAQMLRLELIANAAIEEKTRGEIWFDDLKITRAPPPQKEP